MTIIEAINQYDSLQKNTFSLSQKIKWLSRLDSELYRDIVMTHQTAVPGFEGYTDETPKATRLIAYEPYDEIYIKWLEAQVADANGETIRYNNAASAVNSIKTRFRNDYNRHNPNINRRRKFW